MASTHTTPAPTLTELLFERANVGLCLVAPDGTVVRVNAEWLRSTGYGAEKVVGEDVVELFPETRDMALALHARARAGHHVEVPRHAQSVNGRETWWEGSIDPVPMEGGTGLLITARDVTPPAAPGELERAAEEALRAAARLRTLVSALPLGVVVAGADGRITLANAAAQELVGGVTGDARGPAGGYPLHRPEGGPFPADELPLVRALRGEAAPPVELVARRADGSERVLLAAGVPILDERGASTGALAVLQDVTERKRQDAALRASEERFRLLADAMPQIVCVLAPDGGVEAVNATWTAFSGLDSRATARAGWERVVHPDDVAAARECRRLALKRLTPQDVELRYRAADGTYRWFLSRLAPVVEQGRVVRFIGAAMEIEQRKRVELALRESEARFRAMGETLPYGVWLCNEHGGAEYVSQSFLDLLEMTPDEQREFGWTRRLPPEDVQPMLDGWLRCVRTGEMWDSEHRILGPDGRYHHVLTRGLPVRDASGKITGWVGIHLDIDKRKEMEEALREADRRKDDFLAMLSHELRNPLAPIRNSAYILRHADPASDQARRSVDTIERQTEHLTRLVDDLLDVTRVARGKIDLRPSRVDLRDVVSRAADDFRAVMRDRGIAFAVELPEGRVWADVDATRITQAVGNLLHNAAKFTRRGDAVTLALAVAGAEAHVRVRDTGAGIDEATLPTVFHAFVQGERTRARAEGGLGLGLALVKGIAELHGGRVDVRSEGVGRGAEFVVRLPLASSAGPAARRRPAAPPRPRHPRRVLVVDDDADAAESLADVVRMFGHEVSVAYDGPTALDVARGAPPDVVLCDIGLPGMDGYDVAKALRELKLDRLQLVAVSGYAQPEDVKRAIDAGFDGHVAKPCDPEQIAQLLG